MIERASNPAQSSSDAAHPAVAIITVCVSLDELEQITQAVNSMPWETTYDSLQHYVTDPARAHWSSQVKAAQNGIAIVDLDEDSFSAMATVEALQETFGSKLWIIALSGDRDPATILNAMRAGCSEYLDKPLDSNVFAQALARFDRRNATVVAETRSPGRILSFFGAKGGVGTSTLAVHLALYLVRSHKKKTLLIDNHSELGHVCLYLGLQENSYHFHELIRNVNRLDTDLLKGFVLRHSSGLDVLAAPQAHGGVRNSDPEALENTLQILRHEYDYLVLDCAPSFEETNRAVFESSDLVYLIATPEIGAIRDLSRYIDGLLQGDQGTEKLRVVMNRCLSKEAMSTVQIEKALRLPLSIQIQNSYAEIVKAINTGEPVSPEKRSSFSTQMQQWANDIVGDAAPQNNGTRKKGFAFWK